MVKFRYLLFLLLILVAPMQGCRSNTKAVKAERNQQRLVENRQAESQAAFKRAQKRHQSVQTKETRKRMKESAKQSEKLRIKNRKPSLVRRIFGKSR